MNDSFFPKPGEFADQNRLFGFLGLGPGKAEEVKGAKVGSENKL